MGWGGHPTSGTPGASVGPKQLKRATPAEGRLSSVSEPKQAERMAQCRVAQVGWGLRVGGTAWQEVSEPTWGKRSVLAKASPSARCWRRGRWRGCFRAQVGWEEYPCRKVVQHRLLEPKQVCYLMRYNKNTASLLWYSWQRHRHNLIMSKHHMRDILQNDWPIFLQSVKDIKVKERRRNYSRLKETGETWGIIAWCGLELESFCYKVCMEKFDWSLRIRPQCTNVNFSILLFALEL